jgi:hypothetical protein
MHICSVIQSKHNRCSVRAFVFAWNDERHSKTLESLAFVVLFKPEGA